MKVVLNGEVPVGLGSGAQVIRLPRTRSEERGATRDTRDATSQRWRAFEAKRREERGGGGAILGESGTDPVRSAPRYHVPVREKLLFVVLGKEVGGVIDARLHPETPSAG